MLTLCWSDGNSLISVNSCLLASSKESNIIGPKRSFDKRTIAGKRRELAQTKAPKAMLTLLDNATKAGLSADYVLFDSWFATPAQITDVKSRGIDVIAMIKKSSRIKYEYCGKQLSIKEIYSQNKKRRGRSKYLLSVDVKVRNSGIKIDGTFEAGNKIDNLENNKGHNFPTFDIVIDENGKKTAISTKSLDLTSKSYTSKEYKNQMYYIIKGYIDDINNFKKAGKGEDVLTKQR